MQDTFRKILIVGSGAVKIAEAAEFDYSGSQALKALKEEGIESVIVNPNIATIQTSKNMADKIYLLPITGEFVEKVLEKERPDGIMIGFGGQSALNAGVELYKKGVLEKYHVKMLGTDIEKVEIALSREGFKKRMKEIGIAIPPSVSAANREEAVRGAETLRYPIMIRASFSLGGRGSIIAHDEKELVDGLDKAFAQSGTGEILLEEHLKGWKEIEYEVVRDRLGNCAVTACIENMDPMGVHTGESTVVTPSQTLNDSEYQKMRSTAIIVAEDMKLVGECNVQFALNPSNGEFCVIETNPRMSRSSALASKATGYPLAYVSAKLALGYNLYEIRNTVSGYTTACFEPSLDYITIKAARWDLEKFDGVTKSLGTEMKSTGEIMSIGRGFEEAMQKAVRMLDIGEPGLVGGKIYDSVDLDTDAVLDALGEKRPYWFLYAARAMKDGIGVERLHEITHVDRFFLKKIEGVVKFYERFRNRAFNDEEADTARRLGFSELQLHMKQTMPKIKRIDTVAGEWPANTNYLYSTFNGSASDTALDKKGGVLVLGAGGFRIGTSLEFDWSTVSLMRGFNGTRRSAVLNCNPETVSTDWDEIGELYFDEITEDTVAKIYTYGKFDSVALFTAGQTGNNMATGLERRGMNVYGSSAKAIDTAEDREKFSKLAEHLGILQPEWISAVSLSEVEKFTEKVGFPIIVRPSYVLSGSAMRIVNNREELKKYVSGAVAISKERPVVVSKYFGNSIEAELDCVGDSRNVIGIGMSHLEEAGVHSGDATIVTPCTIPAYDKMKEVAVMLTNEMSIRGPFNIQFVVKDGKIYVIELNLRASRSMPYSSKAVGINLIEHAIKGIESKFDFDGFYEPEHKSYLVKSPQFSWSQLRGAYPHLSPEMHSTGEVASFGKSIEDALVKSWLGASPNRIPKSKILIYGKSNVNHLQATANHFDVNRIVTLSNAEACDAESLSVKEAVAKMKTKEIDMVITDGNTRDIDYDVRRAAADLNVPLVLNGRLAEKLADAMKYSDVTYSEMKDYL